MGGAETDLHPYADSAARRTGMLDSRRCRAAVDALKIRAAVRRRIVGPASGHARTWHWLVLLVAIKYQRQQPTTPRQRHQPYVRERKQLTPGVLEGGLRDIHT